MMSAHLRIIGLVALAICLLSTAHASPPTLDEVAAELKDLPDHPRLLWTSDRDAAVLQKIDEDTTLKTVRDELAEYADSVMEAPTLTRKKEGIRLLHVSREGIRRILALSTLWRLTGEERYADRARDEMLAIARFSDWNPDHFLDVGEMTAALALGYDWIYPTLSDDARTSIAQAIIDKGLKTSLDDSNPLWWVDTSNNWNQVCHGGLTLGALAVADRDPDLAARIITRAVANAPYALEQYAPDGAYPEGPAYWQYGTKFHVIMFDALDHALGTDWGLSGRAGFLGSAEYYLHTIGPSGNAFNYADASPHRNSTPTVAWFARRLNAPHLLWYESDTLKAELEAGNASERFLALWLVWADRLNEPPAPERREYFARGPNPVALMRSAWDPKAAWVGFKGGDASVNHAHMDAGSFVYEINGIRWAIDLPAENYHRLESMGIRLFDRRPQGDRWRIFRYQNRSHNTLTVNGRLQKVNAYAPLIRRSRNGDEPRLAVTDMSEVYAGQLQSAHRGVALLEDGSLLVRDEVTATTAPAVVRWAMVHPGEPCINGHRGEVSLLHENQQLHLSWQGEGEPPQWEVFLTDPPPSEFDSPNTGTSMIGFKMELDPGESRAWSVHLYPNDADAPGTHTQLGALGVWGVPF